MSPNEWAIYITSYNELKLAGNHFFSILPLKDCSGRLLAFLSVMS